MIATFVHVWVKLEFIAEFLKATEENHKKSVKEPGNLRFDILKDPTDENKFVFYEAYISEESAADHKKTDHYIKWRDTVAPFMAKPREGIKHIILYPEKK